eukprot:Polyplicarium_translucidae@DN2640_c0_g1_i1.p1
MDKQTDLSSLTGNISQEQANALNQSAATVLLVDNPPNLSVGLDFVMFRPGPKFRGFKLVPPGVHYLYWSVRSMEEPDAPADFEFESEQQDILRVGQFIELKNREVLVLKWDAATELFAAVETEEAGRFEKGVRNFEFDSNLGCYPLKYHEAWQAVSMFITPSVLHKLEPVGKRVRSTRQPLRAEYSEQPAGAESGPDLKRRRDNPNEDQSPEASDEPTVADYEQSFEDEGSGVFYSDVPRNPIPANATPAVVTSISHDRSSALEKLLADDYSENPTDLLGEVQYSYISFLVGECRRVQCRPRPELRGIRAVEEIGFLAVPLRFGSQAADGVVFRLHTRSPCAS